MSRVEDRLAVLDSPERARSLLTVRAAISSARFVLSPRCSALSLTCSYWRSRSGLEPRGMTTPRRVRCRHGGGSTEPTLRLPVPEPLTPAPAARPATPSTKGQTSPSGTQRAADHQLREDASVTMNGLIDSVRFIGSLGVHGVFISEDPGAAENPGETGNGGQDTDRLRHALVQGTGRSGLGNRQELQPGLARPDRRRQGRAFLPPLLRTPPRPGAVGLRALRQPRRRLDQGRPPHQRPHRLRSLKHRGTSTGLRPGTPPDPPVRRGGHGMARPAQGGCRRYPLRARRGPARPGPRTG